MSRADVADEKWLAACQSRPKIRGERQVIPKMRLLSNVDPQPFFPESASFRALCLTENDERPLIVSPRTDHA
jgi:hypothetical protein